MVRRIPAVEMVQVRKERVAFVRSIAWYGMHARALKDADVVRALIVSYEDRRVRVESFLRRRVRKNMPSECLVDGVSNRCVPVSHCISLRRPGGDDRTCSFGSGTCGNARKTVRRG